MPVGPRSIFNFFWPIRGEIQYYAIFALIGKEGKIFHSRVPEVREVPRNRRRGVLHVDSLEQSHPIEVINLKKHYIAYMLVFFNQLINLLFCFEYFNAISYRKGSSDVTSYFRDAVMKYSRYVARGKGILQPHHLIDEVDKIIGDDPARKIVNECPFSEVSRRQ
ncbi:hypothetical protein ACJIZ3_017771 [Penstemon smallii]|uniref:Sucrose synthase N-terminal domain-containing protein n=1 Tax=Penstemon smallii TaxID=265156 RepID=A0ABD3SWH2_9LAMI